MSNPLGSFRCYVTATIVSDPDNGGFIVGGGAEGLGPSGYKWHSEETHVGTNTYRGLQIIRC